MKYQFGNNCRRHSNAIVAATIPAMRDKNKPVGINHVLAHHVKAHRDARGWTQEDLARESGIVLPTIQLIENPGKREANERLNDMRRRAAGKPEKRGSRLESSVGLSFVQALADAFRIPIVELLMPIDQVAPPIPTQGKRFDEVVRNLAELAAEQAALQPGAVGRLVLSDLSGIKDRDVARRAEARARKAINDYLLRVAKGQSEEVDLSPAKRTTPKPQKSR